MSLSLFRQRGFKMVFDEECIASMKHNFEFLNKQKGLFLFVFLKVIFQNWWVVLQTEQPLFLQDVSCYVTNLSLEQMLNGTSKPHVLLYSLFMQLRVICMWMVCCSVCKAVIYCKRLLEYTQAGQWELQHQDKLKSNQGGFDLDLHKILIVCVALER